MTDRWRELTMKKHLKNAIVIMSFSGGLFRHLTVAVMYEKIDPGQIRSADLFNWRQTEKRSKGMFSFWGCHSSINQGGQEGSHVRVVST